MRAILTDTFQTLLNLVIKIQTSFTVLSIQTRSTQIYIQVLFSVQERVK